MKMHTEVENADEVNSEADDYMREIFGLENVEGYISCVLLGDDRTKTFIAANPDHMLMFAEELVKIAMTLKLGSAGETLQ
jgi:hypothetical protein